MITLNKKTPLNKPVLISSVAVIIIILLCIIYVYGLKGNLFGWSMSNSSKPGQVTTPSAPTPTPKSITPTQATPASVKASPGSDQPQAPTTQPDGSKVVGIAVTSTDQTAPNYHIGVVIYSVQSGGTCTLNLSKQGATTITQVVDVQALPSSSTCKGFDIPTAELNSGTWQVSVVFSNPPYSGSTTQNIKIN